VAWPVCIVLSNVLEQRIPSPVKHEPDEHDVGFHQWAELSTSQGELRVPTIRYTDYMEPEG
jgi:hypothetical protein